VQRSTVTLSFEDLVALLWSCLPESDDPELTGELAAVEADYGRRVVHLHLRGVGADLRDGPWAPTHSELQHLLQSRASKVRDG
jgi:hypothetical protein